MHTDRITMERHEARELYEKYRMAQTYGTAVDREVARTYRLLSQGKIVIRALDSIKNAGLNEEGLPKLAIVRADKRQCFLRAYSDGSARFTDEDRWTVSRSPSRTFRFPAGTFTFPQNVISRFRNSVAVAPTIPAYLRPKQDIANYHILWEAEWENRIPVDPMLLRRLSKGDLWVVMAAWDLTEVERAVLQARV